MKTIVEALKDLYVALGGKEQDVANLVLNPDVIEKIAAAAGDAVKPELPSLTGNAGKFLKVDSDAEGVEWAEAGGGGSGGNVINLEENSEYALNMKYSDIVDALNEHKQIIVWVNASTWGSEEYPSDILRAFVLACGPSSGLYKVKALMYDAGGDGTAKVLEYVARTEDGYPVFVAG